MENIELKLNQSENVKIVAVIPDEFSEKNEIVEFFFSAYGVKTPDSWYCDRYYYDEPRRWYTYSYSLYLLQHKIDDKSFILHLLYNRHQLEQFLEMSDCALFLIDCRKGLQTKGKQLYFHAIKNQIQITLFFYHFDKLISLKKIDGETCYQFILNAIQSINDISSIFYYNYDHRAYSCSLTSENIIIGSSTYCWSITIEKFASVYQKKLKFYSTASLINCFSGEYFFDPILKSWVTQPKSSSGLLLVRGCVQFVFDPLLRLYRFLVDCDQKQVELFAKKTELNFEYSSTKVTLFFKVCDLLLDTSKDNLVNKIIARTPDAQWIHLNRLNILYPYPEDHISEAIKECSPTGPLIAYISRPIVTPNQSRPFRLARIYSGKMKTGQKIKLVTKDSQFQIKLQSNKNIFKIMNLTYVYSGGISFVRSKAYAGHCVCFFSDMNQNESGTIYDDFKNENLLFCHTYGGIEKHILSIKIEPRNVQQLPFLHNELRKLAKQMTSIELSIDDSGSIFLRAQEVETLEEGINLLENTGCNQMNISKPFIHYRETILSPSSKIVSGFSANKHNKIYCTAEPVSTELVSNIETHKFLNDKTDRELSKVLVTDFNWDINHTFHIFSYEKNKNSTNFLVDIRPFPQFRNEIIDSFKASFEIVTQEGILCDEMMRGVKINLVDDILITDAIHRGGGQLIPLCRNVFYGCELVSNPTLQEPFYCLQIYANQFGEEKMFSLFENYLVEVISKNQIRGTSIVEWNIAISVANYIQAKELLLKETYFFNIVNVIWKSLNPYSADDKTQELVHSIRIRKGLSKEIKSISDLNVMLN